MSLAFQIFTWNLRNAHPCILNFDKPTEMSTKGKN